jgi:hypothetical protein
LSSIPDYSGESPIASLLTMLLSLAQWIQARDFFIYLRVTRWAYPVILSLHMVAIAFFGGMILMTDFRLLGWAMRGRSVSGVLDQLRLPKRVGFTLMATLGFLLLGCKAEEYYYNVFFRVKMLLLGLVAIHAFVFRQPVYNRKSDLEGLSPLPTQARVAAALSLFLWAGIACMGRGIGYIDPPFGIQARLWPF